MRESGVRGVLPQGLFRFIPVGFGVSLESLENAVFPFASGNSHQHLDVVDSCASPEGPVRFS
jgi:hypothetical protein